MRYRPEFAVLGSPTGAVLVETATALLHEAGTVRGMNRRGALEAEDLLKLILLLVVILVKPYGLFGTERIERL